MQTDDLANIRKLLMIENRFHDLFKKKRVAILGFGKEGQSTFRRLKQYLPDQALFICDRRKAVRNTLDAGTTVSGDQWFLGPDYLRGLTKADIIIKSPGIPFSELADPGFFGRITSQTELFLGFFREQITGISGTKGKSTTASIIYHIIKTAGRPAVLAGNIGTPCFELLDDIGRDTEIVFEMSSHQLQGIKISPRIAVLLNIFEEHLDHYASFGEYQQAKMNIVRWQGAEDIFIYDADSPILKSLVSSADILSQKITLGDTYQGSGSIYCSGDDMVYSNGQNRVLFPRICKNRIIPGHHNLKNIAAAVAVAVAMHIPADNILEAVSTFRGLPHRMEYVGTYKGIVFYNDSIATIPEATMAAVKAFPDTETLILGGKDRGVDYIPLMDFLSKSPVMNILFTGDAGDRMMSIAKPYKGFERKRLLSPGSFDEAVKKAIQITREGKVCLLSPAAASYDTFKNFEERGERFTFLVQNA